MKAAKLHLRVRAAETIAPSLKSFTLEAADESELPATGPGSHLRLALKNGSHGWRNAYSIAAASPDRREYRIIVRRAAYSRGGSAFLHEAVQPGHLIEAEFPGNLFPMVQIARKHLLVSGGIGITPFLSYLGHLKALGTPFELHHFCRAEEVAIFENLLGEYDSSRIFIHPEATQFDLVETLRTQPLGAHLYVCGPAELMDLIIATARAHGWPASKYHSESFGGVHAGGAPFVAILQRAGVEVRVGEDQTLLEALEAAGLEPSCLCRGGACGECRTEVIEGVPEHRDHYLDANERATNRAIMICVSRAMGDRIVLDL
ncbi:MAG: PDR/VanB family oxidoreductase [Methylovirgula sp.]|uniref:PDR/VanB family oxidoreductase n=1 Tax=Methylovirgula sp. TaxID=1978224 RepID=UPI003076371F